MYLSSSQTPTATEATTTRTTTAAVTTIREAVAPPLTQAPAAAPVDPAERSKDDYIVIASFKRFVRGQRAQFRKCGRATVRCEI
jgi:hypothetical protein